ALGVRSDSANDGDSVQSGRTSRYSVAHLGAALAVLLVLAAGGAFLMLKPARDTAGDNAIASAAATANDPKAAPAAPSANAGQRPSGLAATPLLPAPAASRPPPAVLPSVPAPSPQATAAAPATAKPDPKPAVV